MDANNTSSNPRSEQHGVYPQIEYQELDWMSDNEGNARLAEGQLTMDTQISEGHGNEQDARRLGSDTDSSSPSETEADHVSLLTHVTSLWYLAVIILAPIVCCPILILVDEEFQRQARCGYVIMVMAIFWTTEAIPIAVTSLLPVVMFPMLGVLTARQTSAVYFNDTSMLFVGGLLVAIAIEVWDVHKRIALLTLRIVGAEPRCLLFGIILVTWFLSMWISNTATTAMMMTIVQALMEQFEELYMSGADRPHDTNTGNGRLETHQSSLRERGEEAEEENLKHAKLHVKRLGKALCLSVAYSANIGGVASLTGTGPNLVLFAASQKVFEDVGLESPITFSTWLVYGLPLSLICVLILWCWLVIFFLRCSGGCSCLPCCARSEEKRKLNKINDVIHREYDNLGPLTFAQGTIFICFFLLVTMWISRDVGGAGGWADWFPPRFVSDSTPSILMALLMFVLPSSIPDILRNGTKGPFTRVKPLLNWKHVHEKMPWSLYLLLGGGYAIARAATDSGLSAWLGEKLLVFRSLDQWLILLVITYIVTFATEVTSNTAMATLMMPILSQMAKSLELNPLFFMYPCAIATSFAFMLPVATPPNAIVFSNGNIRVIDMITCGILMNIVCVPVLILATATWGNAFFNFDQVPPEFLQQSTINSTTAF